MRPRVKTGGLELPPGGREFRTRFDAVSPLREKPIDVEHPKPDALHVKGANGNDERLAFGDQFVARLSLGMGFKEGDEGGDVALSGLAVIHETKNSELGTKN